MMSFKLASFLTVLVVMRLILAGRGGGERSKPPSVSGGSGQAETSGGEASGKAPRVRPGSVGEKVSVSGGSFTRLSPERSNAMLKDDIALIIPYNETGQKESLLPDDKNARIVLYCLGGPMSYSAATTLVKLGYTNISDLKGGMAAWRRAGLPLKGA